MKKLRKQTSALEQAPDRLRRKITLRLFALQINDQLHCGAINTSELLSKPGGGNFKGDGEGRVRASRNNNKCFWVEKPAPGAG